MAITAPDYQATALTPTAPTPEPGAETERPLDPDRIGIVFVHGIGTQQPAETFLEWSAPIVRILTAWRIEHGFPADPVVRSEFSFSGSSQPYLELEIPAVDAFPARRWVLTEAWWAAQIKAPSLGAAAAYVRRGLPRILRGITEGYKFRTDLWRDRLKTELKILESKNLGAKGAESLAMRELTARRRWGWIEWLDATQKGLTVLAYVPVLVLGSLLLLLYAPFRLIPIKAIRDAAILRSADNFLTTWFGDLPDVLDDPVQSANVRARLAESIDRLETQMRCGSMVLVAHSGGAIVSFTTLLDPAYLSHRVDRLITIGNGLALGWRLDDTGRPGATPRSDRLTGDLVKARPDLRWADVWASYDPAPAGPIVAPPGVTISVDTRPVTNRMSIVEDHGTYWDNDEGFLIPLLRYADAPRGDPDTSRFYRDSTDRLVRIERRRQRVAVLALWRWIATLGGLVPIVVATIAWAASAGAVRGPAALGTAVADWIGTLPGHQLLSGPLDFLAGGGDYPDWIAAFGAWLLGALVVGLAFWAIAIVGGRLWASWDERERAVARLERLSPIHRRDVAVVATLMVVLTVALSADAFKLLWG